jgi:retinol dehydrogenase-12
MPDSKANPIWRFYREQRLNLPLPTAADVAGRTFVVTGGNTGLGYECAAHLVALGAARVVLGVRSVDKGEAARAAMEQAAGRTGVVQVWPVDLGSLASVEAFVVRIASLERVDALVNNAGIELDRFATLEDGLETSLVVNVVGTLLLCLRALPVLAASAKKHGEQARMEIVSSGIIMGLTSESLDGLGGGNVFEALSKEETMEGQRWVPCSLARCNSLLSLLPPP